MCPSCSKNRKMTPVITVKNNCNGLRKRMIRVKKYAYSRFKDLNNPEDKDTFDTITTNLKDLRYCPDEKDVLIYESNYGL